MSLRQERAHEAALSELEQARKTIESGYGGGLRHGRGDRGLSFDWVFARILLQQAKDALETPLDSVAPQLR